MWYECPMKEIAQTIFKLETFCTYKGFVDGDVGI